MYLGDTPGIAQHADSQRLFGGKLLCSSKDTGNLVLLKFVMLVAV